ICEFKEYLMKLDKEQDRNGVDEMIAIMSNYENGIEQLFAMVDKFALNYIISILYDKLNMLPPHTLTNGTFLLVLLSSSRPNLTADSIRTRFKMGFLNLLTKNQILRVLSALLRNELTLQKDKRIELVEMVFGHIDFSTEMEFSVDQVTQLIIAILNSEVPECFEQVFLTWKMWGIFGIEQQEAIFNSYYLNLEKGRIYYRETLVMLYLFILNRDRPNAEICKNFHSDIKAKYGEDQVYNENFTLRDVILHPYLHIPNMCHIVNTFDNCLLDLPEVLKKTNTRNLKNFTKMEFNMRHKETIFNGQRYKIHFCYVLTKFNQDYFNGENSDIGLLDDLYFDIKTVRIYFKALVYRRDRKYMESFEERTSRLILESKDRIEIKNTFGALRQIVQDKRYNHNVFIELFKMINIQTSRERVYTTFLFLLTNEKLLRDVERSSFWITHRENLKSSLPKKVHTFKYIEDVFMYNASEESEHRQTISCSAHIFLRRIDDFLNNLISEVNGNYRERNLAMRLFFHPKFKIFKEFYSHDYIYGLTSMSLLDIKEDRVQLARDFILNDYYYESAINGGHDFFMDMEDLRNMKILSEAVEDVNDKIDLYRKREKEIMGSHLLE
ncbi:hypothetical protein PAEPH01_2316, partial [Pancytospora epiphaga]